jgi:hypothetical protein
LSPTEHEIIDKLIAAVDSFNSALDFANEYAYDVDWCAVSTDESIPYLHVKDVSTYFFTQPGQRTIENPHGGGEFVVKEEARDQSPPSNKGVDTSG